MKSKNWKNIVIFIMLIVISILSAAVFLLYKKAMKKRKAGIVKIKSEIITLDNFHKFLNYESIPVEHLEKLDFLSPEILKIGESEMKKHKAVFTGISRDDAVKLPIVMKHIEYIGNKFKDYRVVVFENDSSDGTKLFLKLWSNINDKVTIISKDFNNQKRPSIKFMSDARNEYLKVLNEKKFDGFDIVIPIDMDMSYGVDIRGVQDSFSKIDRWDVVCSNGIFTSEGHMYDAFAFRDKEFTKSILDYDADTKTYKWNSVLNKKVQKIYKPESDLHPVYSCFGGMAIYKKEFMKDCFYDSENEDCEHVYLHKCMREKYGARIFLNPAQILRYTHYR